MYRHKVAFGRPPFSLARDWSATFVPSLYIDISVDQGLSTSYVVNGYMPNYFDFVYLGNLMGLKSV